MLLINGEMEPIRKVAALVPVTLVNADDDNVNTEIKTATYTIESIGTMAEIFAALASASAARGLHP